MQKITPFLCFNKQAEEVANYYCSIFKNSKTLNVVHYGDAGPGPKGSVLTVQFQLEGQEFVILNGGPSEFKFNPAISFLVNCNSTNEVNELWYKLSEDGKILMGLDKYPFSERYGWLEDKYGVSWQLYLSSEQYSHMQKISPVLMFTNENSGKAEEAINYYISQFGNSGISNIVRYTKGEEGKEGTVKMGIFSLDGQTFMAMDSPIKQDFTFSPSISFFVNCNTQEEVDRLWKNLSSGGAEGQCGWLTDKYGLTWQVVPEVLLKLIQDEDPKKSNNVMQAMLRMHKLEIDKLLKAYQIQ